VSGVRACPPEDTTAAPPARARLLTVPFALLALSTLAFFTAEAMLPSRPADASIARQLLAGSVAVRSRSR
jgi:hypothetical protein